jgi:hypothetical protein
MRRPDRIRDLAPLRGTALDIVGSLGSSHTWCGESAVPSAREQSSSVRADDSWRKPLPAATRVPPDGWCSMNHVVVEILPAPVRGKGEESALVVQAHLRRFFSPLRIRSTAGIPPVARRPVDNITIYAVATGFSLQLARLSPFTFGNEFAAHPWGSTHQWILPVLQVLRLR